MSQQNQCCSVVFAKLQGCQAASVQPVGLDTSRKHHLHVLCAQHPYVGTAQLQWHSSNAPLNAITAIGRLHSPSCIIMFEMRSSNATACMCTVDSRQDNILMFELPNPNGTACMCIVGSHGQKNISSNVNAPSKVHHHKWPTSSHLVCARSLPFTSH